MEGLETDQVMPGLYLGSMADAAYIPFREHFKITHIVNVAAEAQPPVNPDGVKILTKGWRDSEEQGKSIAKGNFKHLLDCTAFMNEAYLENKDNVVMVHCV